MGCYNAAVQVLKDADDLKVKVTKNRDWLNDSAAWTDQQKLQTVYHQVLILDLEYALDKKVELELWNVGFKNHISNLQELVRDKKNPQRSDLQVLLTWSLEAASGFYITLLQELCNTFDIDLPFRKRGNIYGQLHNNTVEQVNIPQLNSCLYICQYCLVHLGDIARYRNQRKQAENFYRQAILVSPTSGHPYNQLALLQASQGDKLSTVFYYIRATAVKNPFPASKTNLLSVLSATIEKDSFSEKINTKMSVNEFIQLFLCTHGYLHTVTDLKEAEIAVKTLNSVMTALVAVQSFNKNELMKITVINMYTLKHLGKQEELTEDEKKVRNLVLELLAGSLSALLMPVHTLKMDETLLGYYALPSIKLLMYFIKNEPSVLKEEMFSQRLQIWPALCKFINNTQKYLKGFKYNKYAKFPLSEDRDLQGFLPLARNMKEFNFKDELEDTKLENLIRLKRIVDFTLWLSDFDISDAKLVTRVESLGLTKFEPSYSQPDPTNDLLEEMRTFNMIDVTDNNNLQKKVTEKKGGILKPQGSLEKSRESREGLSEQVVNDSNNSKNIAENVKIKRSKQNVALQSIYKKMEESGKQVKFNVETAADKEKSVKFDSTTSRPPIPAQQPLQKPPNQTAPFNLPLRTQSFNQNHPAFPLPPPQPPQGPPLPNDYLANLRNISSKENHSMLPQFSHQTRGFAAFPHKNTQSTTAPHFPQNYPQSSLHHFPPQGNSQFIQNAGQYTPQQFPKSTQFPQNSHFAQDSSVAQFTKASTAQFPPQSGTQFLPNTPQFSQFNTWNRDETRQDNTSNPTTNAWWSSNANTPPQNFLNRSDNTYPPQLGFPTNPPQYHGGYSMSANPNKPSVNPGSITTPYDMFGASPWSNNLMRSGTRSGYGTEDSLPSAVQGYDNSQALSIRQAMLKEANLHGVAGSSGGGARGPPQDKPFPVNPPTQGYSLFSNSWTPNLAGQLSTNKLPENVNQPPQHSLFGGHGPTSLAQLLEHQQSQMKKDDNT